MTHSEFKSLCSKVRRFGSARLADGSEIVRFDSGPFRTDYVAYDSYGNALETTHKPETLEYIFVDRR